MDYKMSVKLLFTAMAELAGGSAPPTNTGMRRFGCHRGLVRKWRRLVDGSGPVAEAILLIRRRYAGGRWRFSFSKSPASAMFVPGE